jgi:DNA-binding NarL/FixJ family response regulator
LTDREFQVLCLLAKGKKLKGIADELCLSINTISTYRSRILHKMEMESNADLIHYAIKNGMVK